MPTLHPRRDPLQMTNERRDRDLESRLHTVEMDLREVRRDLRHLIEWRQDLTSELAPIQQRLEDILHVVTTRTPLPAPVPAAKSPTESGENRHLTMRDFYIAMGALGTGAMLALKWLAR